jgi:hypothetical protein
MDDEKPPVRRLVLKPREVDPIDTRSRPGDGTEISVRLIHLGNSQAASRPAEPPPADREAGGSEGVPSRFRQRVVNPTDPPSPPGDEAAVSVSGMLQANRVAADHSVPELIAMPPRRKSRRHRDFILLVSCAVLSAGALAAIFRNDLQVFSLALFGIVFLTVILAWVMYGVMDKY